MYAGRPWTIRQYAGFSTAEESERLLPRGYSPQGSIGVSGCIRSGHPPRPYDSDHPRVEGTWAKRAFAIDSVEDDENPVDGIPLDKVSFP